MKRLICATALSIALAPAAIAQTAYPTSPAPTYGSGYAEPLTTGSIVAPAPMPRSSADSYSTDAAADGNARQLAKPTQNYGNVSGGYVQNQP